MEKSWHKLSARDDVDVATICGIHCKTHQLIKQFSGSDEELFYSYYRVGGKFVNYLAIDTPSFGKFLFEKFFNGKSEIEKYIAKGDQMIKKSKSLKGEWEQKEVQSDNDLKDLYNNFLEMYEDIGSIYTFLIFIMVEYWQIHINSVIDRLIVKNSLENDKSKIVRSILEPIKKTAINELREKLLAGEDKKKLLEEYQFLRTWTLIWYKQLDEKFLQDLEQGNNNNKRDLYSQKELYNLLQPNNTERNEIELTPYVTYIKDYRDDMRREFSYTWVFMFKEISKRFNIDYQDLGYLSLNELGEVIRGSRFEDKIKYRKGNSAVVTATRDNYKVVVIDENLPERYVDYENLEVKKNEQIIGLSVFGGNIRANVKIINSSDDIENFPENFVLVANTTHPNYLPAMQRASAFVTNEGGMLCHAAIVARELHKPCIVGTKIATKLLKDGDKVEVDANKGLVKIL